MDAEVGAAFSWLANLRYTGDYGGEAHVQISEAREAVEKAAMVLQSVRGSIPVPENPASGGRPPFGG